MSCPVHPSPRPRSITRLTRWSTRSRTFTTRPVSGTCRTNSSRSRLPAFVIVERVVAQAAARGIPSKSVNTLRLYRDVAIRFPASERVTGVSFSAHREALSGSNNDPALAKQVLIDLSAKHGPAGVTVTTVKAAMGAATGKVVASKSSVRPSRTPRLQSTCRLRTGRRSSPHSTRCSTSTRSRSTGCTPGSRPCCSAVEVKRAKAARKAAQAAKSSKAAPAPARPAASEGCAIGQGSGQGRCQQGR